MNAAAPVVDVVIPALDEERALPLVLRDLAALPPGSVRSIIVVDNGSRDRTAELAREAGAVVVTEPRRGYGQACLTGLERMRRLDPPTEIVVFADADHSDHIDELPSLVDPIRRDRADLVIGSRALGRAERGALLPQQRFGNALATWLIRRLYGVPMTDLGPFRAVRRSTLDALGMVDRDFGWTAEMQVKAARAGVRYVEVPVSYRRRTGRSKIAGTVSGTVGAGWKILSTVFRYAGRRRQDD